MLIKFNFLLLLLLINSGCATCNLLQQARPNRSETHYDHEVINQVTSAYLTPDQELIVCLRGLYEAKPPEQEYAFRVTTEQLEFSHDAQFFPSLRRKSESKESIADSRLCKNDNDYFSMDCKRSRSRVISIPRNQMISECPYANYPPKTWKPVKVEVLSSHDTHIDSLRPVPGTNETIYEQGMTSNKRVIYARNNLINSTILFQIDTVETKHVVVSGGNPFLYLLLPVTIVTDIVTTPILLGICYSLGINGCVGGLTQCN